MTSEHKFTPEQEAEKSIVSATVRKYVDACKSNDRETALQLLTVADREAFSGDWESPIDDYLREEVASYAIEKIELPGKLVIDGNSRDQAKATIDYKTKSGVPWVYTYRLVKEQDWKIYFGSDTHDKVWNIHHEPGREIWQSIPPPSDPNH